MEKILSDRVFNILASSDFEALALEIFRFQYLNNGIYRSFADTLGVIPEKVRCIQEIPFLPIEFFRTRDVLSVPISDACITFFSSSTTSQMPSKHIVSDMELYERSFIKGFEVFYGKPSDYTILALLPNYLERKDSSLVYMFSKLIDLSANKNSGFYLNNYRELKEVMEELKSQNKKVLLIGVTYALLDLAELNIPLNDNFIVMETGGMKGRREEMVKEEVHTMLKNKFSTKQIHSEYGMTELLSQAYSKGDGVFECPPWMKVFIRDMHDPLSCVKENKTGGINVIDLANINSCAFISTQDLGRTKGNMFQVMGRFDNSDIRGCNLMVG